MYITKYLK